MAGQPTLQQPSFKDFHKSGNFGCDYLQKPYGFLEQIKIPECCYTNPFMGNWMLQGDGSWKPHEGSGPLVYDHIFWTLVLS